jgi:hypothetical protein
MDLVVRIGSSDPLLSKAIIAGTRGQKNHPWFGCRR